MSLLKELIGTSQPLTDEELEELVIRGRLAREASMNTGRPKKAKGSKEKKQKETDIQVDLSKISFDGFI